jgi:phenylalanyl-tRNA synthetase alpha subunit
MDDLREKYLTLISAAADEAALEELRVQAVGKKGEISLHMRSLGKMSPEERQIAGPALNALKDEVNSALNARKSAMADAALEERLKSEWLDVTLPGRQRPAGTIHPISQVWEEVTAIFADMGFSVAEGPQIETDWYNFDALNMPGHHPALRATIARRMFCAHIPARCKSAPWKKQVRQCGLSALVGCIGLTMIRPIRRCFTRLKVWRWILIFPWPI